MAYDAKKDVPSEEIQRLLCQVVNHFDKEDLSVRQRQIRTYKELKYYWDGFTNIWWSEVAHDFRIWNSFSGQGDVNADDSYYDKRVNVFRAYLESIIAALSTTVPPVRCRPDDADNALDIETAEAGNIISEQIYSHNDAILLWLHALYIFCTEGMTAAYNYTKEDESYGTYKKETYKDVEEEQYICPVCQMQIPDDEFTDQVRNKFAPDDVDAPLDDLLINKEVPLCPMCQTQLDPNLQKEPILVKKLVGVTDEPKSRQCIEVYGGLYVKVANYAMKQADTPYLIFAYETNYVNIIERYPHLRDKLRNSSSGLSTGNIGTNDPYERWGRLPTQYFSEYPLETPTVRNAWLRPCAFNILPDDGPEILKKKYPDGAKVVLANEHFAIACNEKLDDCWTLSYNPLSDYIIHQPLGALLKSMQDITNDLVSLVIQTIEHGIPQTFVDNAVVNLNAYRQSEVRPGDLYGAKPAAGKSMADAFHEVKTATLSAEVLPFAEKIQELSQFVSGAQPQIFGGAAPNSSKTAAQYSMMRAQALQRLQTPWKMLTVWWKDIFGKVIPAYIKDIQEDEKFVTKDKMGNYVSVFIRKSQLQGKIGGVELEANEQLPVTWQQRKDIVMQLLQAGNPLVMAALADPENLPAVAEAIGLTQFELPGEDDRTKQYEEIKVLLETEPIQVPMQMDPMTGQLQMPHEVPSVDIDPMVDNHQIEFDICRRWAVSTAGRLAKQENPAGYQNVLLHMMRHQNMMMMLQAPPPQNGNAAPDEGGNEQKEPTNSNDSGNNNQQQKPVAQQVKQNVGLP